MTTDVIAYVTVYTLVLVAILRYMTIVRDNETARFVAQTACTPCPNKKRESGFPSNFESNKDILTIFGTEITKTTINLILKMSSTLTFLKKIRKI